MGTAVGGIVIIVVGVIVTLVSYLGRAKAEREARETVEGDGPLSRRMSPAFRSGQAKAQALAAIVGGIVLIIVGIVFLLRGITVG